MIAEAITRLESVRDTLLEHAIQLDTMVKSLKGIEGESTIALPNGEKKKEYPFNASPEMRELVFNALQASDIPMTNKQIARRISRGVSTVTNTTRILCNEQLLEVSGKKSSAYLYRVKRGMAE